MTLRCAYTLLLFFCIFSFTDNCCNDRSTLTGIFGVHVEVKLDCFHAIQGVTQCVKKKDMSNRDRKEFFTEVQNIIRDTSDESSPKRTLPTPSPTCISQKISNILENSKWQEQVPAAALQELRNLDTLHVQKGCLRFVHVLIPNFSFLPGATWLPPVLD
jgi:polyhydroxyalkanoate synthesis regulator phasin